MDKEVLETKLAALIRCVHRINEQNISTLEELEKNIDKQDIIILNLQRAHSAHMPKPTTRPPKLGALPQSAPTPTTTNF